VSTKLSSVTPADVLEAAIGQLSKPDGYTPDTYFARRGTECFSLETPGPDVGATCAIGGVEQAIWILTGQIVTEERGEAAFNNRAASKRTTSRLYAEVMSELNAVARQHRALKAARVDPDSPWVCAIEQLTFSAGKRAVLNAFRKALENVRAS